MAKAKPFTADPVYPFVRSVCFGGDLKTTPWKLRQSQNVYVLSPADRKTVVEAIARHNARLAAKTPVEFAIPDLQRIIANFKATQHKVVAAIMVDLYDHSQGRVGGETAICLDEGLIPNAHGQSEKVWEPGKKWPGTNTYFSITLQPYWLRTVANIPGLATAGRKLTTHATQIAPDVWQAAWLEQGQGFDVRAVTGIIIRVDGEYYRGQSLRGARMSCSRAVAAAKRARQERWNHAVSLIGRNINCPEHLLAEFPELSDMIRERDRRQTGEALRNALMSGRPVDQAVLAEYPELETLQRRITIENALIRGEEVADEVLAEFPDLILRYGMM